MFSLFVFTRAAANRWTTAKNAKRCVTSPQVFQYREKSRNLDFLVIFCHVKLTFICLLICLFICLMIYAFDYCVFSLFINYSILCLPSFLCSSHFIHVSLMLDVIHNTNQSFIFIPILTLFLLPPPLILLPLLSLPLSLLPSNPF